MFLRLCSSVLTLRNSRFLAIALLGPSVREVFFMKCMIRELKVTVIPPHMTTSRIHPTISWLKNCHIMPLNTSSDSKFSGQNPWNIMMLCASVLRLNIAAGMQNPTDRTRPYYCHGYSQDIPLHLLDVALYEDVGHYSIQSYRTAMISKQT